MRASGNRWYSPAGRATAVAVLADAPGIKASRPRPNRLGRSAGIARCGGELRACLIRLRSLHELRGDFHICLRSDRGYVIEDDRLPKARRFCQPHIPRDDGLEYSCAEILPRVRRDLPRQV